MKKNLKRFLAVLMSVCMLFCVGMSAAAAAQTSNPIQPMDLSTGFTLSITGNYALMTSVYNGNSSQIVAVQLKVTLEKHSFLWFWNDCSGTWTQNEKGDYCKMQVSKSNLESGTYRVRNEITIMMKDGSTKTETQYSNEDSVA